VLDLANLHSESGGFVLDGEHFLTFASTGAFEVWDVPAGKRVLDGKHSGDGENVLMSMSANHRFIATAGDKRISAWNLTSGKRIESTLPPGAQVTHIAYRAAMESAADIYVARADGQLRLTSLPNASGFPIVDLSGSIEYVAEQAGGDNMVVIAGGRGYTMRRSEPTRVRQLPRPVSYGSLSVETGRLTTVSPDGVVSLYSRDLVTLLGTYRVASTAPKKISYNETTGRLLVLADNRVTQWNLSPPLERLTVFGAGEGDSAGIQFSVSGDRALVWSDKAGVAVRLIDVESRKLLAALGPDGSATAERALFDPSGRYAASVAGVFDAKTGQVVCHSRVEADHQLLAQAFDDGYTITTMTGQAFLVAFADCSIMGMTRARRLGTTEYKVPATSAVVTSDGHVTVGYSDGTVIRWGRGTLEAARAASEGSPFRLTATGDEKFVLARTGQTMSVWDAQTLELRSNFGPAQSSFRVLGNDRVMAWTNTNVYIWRIPGGEVAMDIPHDVLVDESPIRHDAADGTASYTRSLSIVGMILSADASSDGKIASITNSDIAYVWGPGGERLYKFELPAPATDIRFHPDGNTIAMTSGSDLLFWDVAPESRSSEEIDRLLEERGLAVTP
jgi:WD40 repeat protein